MDELNELMKAFYEAGGDKGIFENRDVAYLAASGHKILSTGIRGLLYLFNFLLQ